MMMKNFTFIFVLVVSLWRGNVGQSQWASWTNNNSPDSGVSGKKYFMDSSTDCNGRFLVNNPTMLYGHSSGTGSATAAPLTCHITFWTDDIRTKRKFAIQVEAAAIGSEGVNFYIYDGDTGSTQKLRSFSANKNTPNIPLMHTSGGFVTFTLQRNKDSDKDFTIIVKVTPMQGDIDTVNECEAGAGPNCVYFYNELPVTKEVIIGIVGGIFGLIIVIIIPIIVICCYRKQRGVTRRWDEFKLGQNNTAADIAGSRSSIKVQKEPWTSQSSKQFASIKRSPTLPRSRMSRPSDDDDSVFDDVPKYPPAPPPYSRYDRRDQMDGRDRRDRYDSRYDSRERLERVRRNDRRERDERDRREDRDRREWEDRDRRERNRERDRYSKRSHRTERKSLPSDADSDTSFVQAEDDHPQDNFVERIIEPRVRPKPKVMAKAVKAEEDVYDVLDEGNSEPEKSDQGIQCEQSDEEDNESNTETTETESTETESDEDKPDPRAALYAKPSKKAKAQPTQPQMAAYPQNLVTAPMMQPAFPRPVVPNPMGVPQGMSAYPPPGVVVRPVHPQPYFAPGAYNQPTMMRPGVPAQPVQNHFRPVQPGYPQGQTVRPQPQPSQARMIKPQDPPVYSYLVQRGYTPLEPGRNSPHSSTGTSHNSEGAYHTEESDVGPNLQSGVDLMRRSTTTTV